MVRNAILVLLFSLSAAVVKAVDYTNGGVWNDPDHNGAPVRYFVDNGCAIIGTEGGGAALSDNYYEYFHADRHLEIPSQIDGFAVVGIASNAFYQTSEGHPIDLDYSIPESVTNIGVNAFGEYPEKCIVDGWLLALNPNFYDGGTSSGTIVLPKCIRGIADGVLRQDDLHVKFLGKPPVHWPTRAPTSYDILIPVEFESEWSNEIVDGKWRGMYVKNWDWGRHAVSLYDLKRDGSGCDYREWIVDDNGYGMSWYYSVTNTCRYRVRYDGEVERIEDESCLTNGFAIIQKSEDGHSYVNYLSDRDVILPSYLGGHPVREIGEGVFANSSIHATVMLSSNITVIGANAFGGSSITNITIPPSVTNIGEGAFSECGNLDRQSLYGFRGVIKDGWVLSVQEASEVPDGIKGIAGGAFAECSSVGVSLPTSVVYICNGAFDCSKVYGVYVREGNPHYCSVDGTLYNADKTVLIRAGAPYYGNDRFAVPTGVVDICDYAFFGNGLRDVTIPDTVRHIGRWAFAGCFDEGVTIKDGWLLTVVGDGVSVRLPYNIRGIADGALYDRWQGDFR